MVMGRHSGKVRGLGIVSVILIVVISYTLFFYLQNTTENNIKNRLFDQQKQTQFKSTKALSEHISSDLDSIMTSLQGLANSAYLQNGLLSDSKTKRYLEDTYTQINTITDKLFVLDKNNTAKINLVTKGQQNFIGTDMSFINWVRETQTEHKPAFSNGFVGLDGNYRIALAYPIINRETGEHLGLIGAVIPTESFFAHYGNIHDINSQFLVVFDTNATLLAVGASKTLVGKDFFGDHTQKFINHNQILNNLTHSLLGGNSGAGVYDYGRGERLNTEHPIFVNGKPTYFIQVVTPTALIYSQVNDVLSTQRLETFSLLAGTTAAIIVLILFLIKWSGTLDNEVKRRTNELNQSNKKLELANEQLKVHDKMQKEFINIASHEIKTPTQAILGFSNLLQTHPEKKDEMVQGISRNADRLQRLTNDILDVTKIESQTLRVRKERFNLNGVISNIVQDYRNHLEKENANVKLLYNDIEHNKDNDDSAVFVYADRERIAQVMSNLLSNAVKFTKDGLISINVMVEKEKGDNKEAVVSIKDTGSGIDPEILPRLFSKFATKSDIGGTGLGLFISKSIIEAHGGKVWAESNHDGEKGSTFFFSLPLHK
jgi:signal transduction histidine kinase